VHSLLFYPGLALEVLRFMLPGAPPSLHARHHNAWTDSRYLGLHDRLDRWTTRHATHVLAVSEAVRITLLAKGTPDQRISVVHNGLDWDREVCFDPAASAEWRKRFPDHLLLVAVGRLVPVKDYSTLLRAHQEVVATHPDALLAIAGIGPERKRLEDEVLRMGLSESVQFLGWVDDIYDLIAAADIFVQASRDESFSQTIVEAMGLGVPVAATTPGGAAEVVEKLYEPLKPGDPHALARRVIETISGRDQARRRAGSIAEEVRSRYSAKVMATGYQALYRRLTHPPAATPTISRYLETRG
jgi:glycosyltransferase involved in cell wall biosynthesis